MGTRGFCLFLEGDQRSRIKEVIEMIVNNDSSINRRFNDREELFVFKAGVVRGWTIAVKMRPPTDCYSEECCTTASAMTNTRVINVGIATTVMYFEIIVADRGRLETHIRIEESELHVNKGKPYPSHMVVAQATGENAEADQTEQEKPLKYQAHVFEIAGEITGISFDDVVTWENDADAEKTTIEIVRKPRGKA